MGLYRDLKFYYGVDLIDVVEGRGPAPSLVLGLVQGLPDTSLTAALANGGTDHFGWGIERHMLANIFDAINLNTKATGMWGKGGAPKFPPAWRPTPRKSIKDRDRQDKPKTTVRDLFHRLSKRGA